MAHRLIGRELGHCRQLRHQEIRPDRRQKLQLLAQRFRLIGAQHQRTHLATVPNRHVRHELDTAGDDNVVGAGSDKAHAGGDGLVRADARHRDGVRRRFVAEAGTERRLARNVGRLHLLDDGAVDDVVDQLLVDLRFAQQAPVG